jgi:hypothetical protein
VPSTLDPATLDPATLDPATLDPVMRSLAGSAALDRAAELVARIGRGAPLRLARSARHVLGHPAHPAFTDIPIGFWTSAWFLDLLPGRAATAVAARRLLGLGVLSSVPAIISGLGDAAGLTHPERRLSATHAGLNGAATAAFTLSWLMRRNNTTTKARLVAHVGAALATAAAPIGGHLAFRSCDSLESDSTAASMPEV